MRRIGDFFGSAQTFLVIRKADVADFRFVDFLIAIRWTSLDNSAPHLLFNCFVTDRPKLRIQVVGPAGHLSLSRHDRADRHRHAVLKA